KGVNNHFRHFHPDRTERLLDAQTVPTVGGQDPRRFDEIGKTDLAEAGPRTCRPDNDHEMIIEQFFDLEVLCVFELAKGFNEARKDHVEFALAEFRKFELRVQGVYLRDLKANSRKPARKLIDDRREDPGSKGFRATNPDFACCRVSEMFNVFDSLPKFGE